MAHTLSFPAGLGQRHRNQPGPAIDGARVAANAGAIATNAVVLLLLLAPVALPPSEPLADPDPAIVWLRPKIEPRPIPVPMSTRKPEPRQPTATAQRTIAPSLTARPVVDSQPGDELAPPIDKLLDTDTGDEAVDLTPQPAASSHLQAIASPSPSYPREAIRDGLTGTVELEILVGTDGKPLEVRVVRSSGHRLLDLAARRVVMTRWLFHPAIHDGRQVQALGRVPIAFTLER